jgi:hypothetical protein
VVRGAGGYGRDGGRAGRAAVADALPRAGVLAFVCGRAGVLCSGAVLQGVAAHLPAHRVALAAAFGRGAGGASDAAVLGRAGGLLGDAHGGGAGAGRVPRRLGDAATPVAAWGEPAGVPVPDGDARDSVRVRARPVGHAIVGRVAVGRELGGMACAAHAPPSYPTCGLVVAGGLDVARAAACADFQAVAALFSRQPLQLSGVGVRYDWRRGDANAVRTPAEAIARSDHCCRALASGVLQRRFPSGVGVARGGRDCPQQRAVATQRARRQAAGDSWSARPLSRRVHLARGLP